MLCSGTPGGGAPQTEDYPFRYALVNRPAAYGCLPGDLRYKVQPRPDRGQPHYEMARHGVLLAARKLTSEEAVSFELAEMIDGAALAELAASIVNERMVEHASEYVESLQDDAAMFSRGVLQAAERSDSGVMRSVGDGAQLVALVVEGLRRVASTGRTQAN
ncbi:hypothetical protein [Ottowia sp.]|uniref:defense against restriction DarA-related protein n=1 Tax=Ottowia sp. TaxID=1898956 RepID=UPI003453C564